MGSKDQKIALLESNLLETKENLHRTQDQSMATLKATMQNFDEEKKQLASKMEVNADDTNKKDIMNYQLEQKIENLKNQTDREIMELKRLQLETEKDFTETREKLNTKSEDNLKLNDEILSTKNTLGKDLALSNQKNEFLTKRINELTDSVEKQRGQYEDRLSHQKDDIANDLKDTLMRVKGERDQLESRYEAKKKNLKVNPSKKIY
jgi:chromosome segregation ATPase